jgi:hypothetical protein
MIATSEQPIPGFSLRWSQVNRSIWLYVKEPLERLQERYDSQLLELVKEHGPINRFELTALACRNIVSKQDMQILITNARRRLLYQGCVRILTPSEFCQEFEQNGPGICFHPDGGYTIKDAHNNSYGNWRTADEAFLAHDKHYSHIPLPSDQRAEANSFFTCARVDTSMDTVVRD